MTTKYIVVINCFVTWTCYCRDFNSGGLFLLQLIEAREKAGKPCDMCNNYEAQLQNIQDDCKKEQMKAKSLERRLNHELQALETKQKYITDLENSLNNSATEAQNQVSWSPW